MVEAKVKLQQPSQWWLNDKHIYNPKPQSAIPARSATGIIWLMLMAAAAPVYCAGLAVVVVAFVLFAARVVVAAMGVVEAALLLVLVLTVLLATEGCVDGLMVITLLEVELGLTVLLLLLAWVTDAVDETEACVEEESLSVLVLRELVELP